MKFLASATVAASLICLLAASPRPPAAGEKLASISFARDGSISYTADAQGNRVPDFSYAGYMEGAQAIPDAPARITVSPVAGDNTARIQAAIDSVASLAPAGNGIRGAVLLGKGRFDIAGALVLSASGVVLRGQGMGEEGTVLVATGTDRRTLITIAGKDDRQLSVPQAITDAYVPVNARVVHVSDGASLKVGQSVFIRRPCTAEWIKALHMNDLGGGLGLGWKPGTREIVWDRVVTAVDGNAITLDAPITTALDAQYGGATITPYSWPGRISQVGVENLRCESDFDAANPKDEAHSWFAVTLANVQDAWVRQMTAVHFVASAVAAWDTSKRITVSDCRSLAPVSEIAQERRQTFFIGGQLTLFEECWSEHGRHDFSAGCCAAGPNAFVQCTAIDALDDTAPIDSWASGLLYDVVDVDGNAISLANRSFQYQFSGWSGANSVLWQCKAAVITCDRPPTAQNWAFGCWGQYSGDGVFSHSNETIKPFSLYYGQLSARLGDAAAGRGDVMEVPSEANSSPSAAKAQELIAGSTKPMPLLSDWIDRAQERHPISTDAAGAKTIEEISIPKPAAPTTGQPLTIQNGWLLCGDHLAMGPAPEVPWWLGGIRPTDVAAARPSLTRWVPGRSGPGLTDDLQQIADGMEQSGTIALEHHYALWYDERDDDHERTRRMNGDVWPPFYELPFARSGQELAWDGLSKYDLTKYNPWYFSRLRQFADICGQRGLILVHQQFFQHNIIEDGAHWASCPWRSANNINSTGFPEPPPYVGDKRIFMAEQWYDMNNPVRTAIYRAYIRKCLDNFAGTTNVIQLTGAEFTGPLSFMRFWLDTVADWEKETGNHVIVGLSATKDVQDAILADPVRSKIVSLIDIRYWWYQSDGKAYAPQGGKNLSPRQWERVLKHTASSQEQIYRAVSEYRTNFPDKPVIYSADGQGASGWAVLMAGGSLAELHVRLDDQLAREISHMHPLKSPQAGQWMLGGAEGYLIYVSRGSLQNLPAGAEQMAQRWFDPRTGQPLSQAPHGGPGLLWLIRS